MSLISSPILWMIISIVLAGFCDLLESKVAKEKLAFENYNLDIGYKSELLLRVLKRLTMTTTALFVLSVVYGLAQTFLI